MTRATLAEDSRPSLPPGVRLRFDKVRDKWVLLAPERVLFPCPTSVAILERCDGEQRLGAIVDALAAEFEAPRGQIQADVVALLGDLADKGFLVEGAGR
jgi:pyrroloquinoline quinone biosynthesis protein D